MKKEMKKNLFMVAAVVLMAMISCNKEQINPGSEPETPQEAEPSYYVEFTADLGADDATSAPQSAATRTILDVKNKKTLWVEDDVISVNKQKFIVKELIDGGKSAKFINADELPADFGAPYTAQYPYNANGTIAIGVTQTAVAGGFDADAVPGVAYSDDNSLSFKNAASLLRFQVSVACDQVVLSSDDALSGTLTVTLPTEFDGVPTFSAATKTVTINGPFETGKDYYAAVLPGTKKNFVVTLDSGISKQAASVEIGRSKIVNMGVLPQPKLPRNLKFSVSEISATRGTDLSEPVLSGVTDGVVYTSSNTAVATVDPASGNVTMLTKGTTEIIAYAAENDTHLVGSVSYTLEVLPVYYGVYVCISDLKWTSVNMHRFNDDGDLTTWPGEALTDKVTVNNKTYYKQEIEEGTILSFTYNNGKASSNFKVDVKDVTVNKDIYYRLSARGAIEVNPNDVSTFGYAIYVFDQKSKNVAPNLYAWNDGDKWKAQYGGNFSSWPGVAFPNDCYYVPADGKNWKHYYYFEIPTNLYNTKFNYIVNKTGQTPDQTSNTVTGDIYVGYWYDSNSSNGFWVNSNLNTPITQ